MKKYVNLNDYCVKNGYKNSQYLLNEIIKQAVLKPDKLIDFLNNKIKDEDFIDKSKYYLSDFLVEQAIYDADQLYEIVNESIKEYGMNSQYIGLVEPLINKPWHSGDWLEVNEPYYYKFDFSEPRDFIKDYFVYALGLEEEKIWIKTHQYVKELEKIVTK
ncbi:Mbov_0392 family ICE element protein [[Mycoplasma] collis]|uniref:Mbov_0392 family ICE element protein n=1 Tax=[Mycoplasma] collis TaxID=2127 RepID=UPI00051BD113|nr:hypothetical protein [[Mycoplasma] collis]